MVMVKFAAAVLSLQLLDLEDNNISDWAEVMHLSQLPSLKHLWVGGNQLQQVHLPSGRFSGSSARCLVACPLISAPQHGEGLHRFVAKSRLSASTLSHCSTYLCTALVA